MGSRAISTKYLVCLTALLLFSFHAAPLRGQVAGATLSGVVSDTTGAGIANTGVSIKNLTFERRHLDSLRSKR